MDRSSSIRALAAQTLRDYEQCAGRAACDESRGSVAILAELARRCFDLTVLDDWDLPAGVRGALDLDAGLIALQPMLAPAPKAFTLAHEIAHCALHHPSRQIQDGDEHLNDEPDASALDAANGVYQSPVARTYNVRDRWELEANLFAAELLAPSAQVREKIRREADWSLDSLAKYFGLSHGAMRNQLASALLSVSEKSGPAESPAVEAAVEAVVTVTLDEKQRVAATVPGPALIVAGPGAG
ncbi:MAG: ATP-dependent helicase UvrD/PcrA, partial [Abditibacteriota bacterium]|nr:ATP-dependent helicase UvrD/PcrA [Abditibacteriota bacterium]